MKELSIKPKIYTFDRCEEFINKFKIGKDDLIITSEHNYRAYFEKFNLHAHVIFIRKYGHGEPSDEMVEAIYKDIKDISYKRVVGIGGGSVLDVSKLFALKTISPIIDLFDHKLQFIKNKELILIPTTCGTGSEVTNISILELKSRHTKLGLAVDELYADYAIMIPELLKELPFGFFATSSIDALIHAIESSVSPKATSYTEMFSYKAMEMILKGYQEIEKYGRSARIPMLKNFLLASNYAGIAFGNAGCGAVHAMSYPLGGNYHVPHGESNYEMFTGVFKKYQALKPIGKITKLNGFLAKILGCKEDKVYMEIEKLLNVLIPKKPLHEYGVSEEELKEFTENVMTKQGRLMANNYTELTRETVYEIYKSLY
ncbi:4-hydroxybutyrate dehydrogenase [Clostridium pasteurianum]|uniref:Alcohol dehydrogenase, class IV n=1 Tax=Clostridium pasteurianum BC1 TaxID=86416 RepID=R4KHC4_CLOPA|nr:4-hydroxybutyrate dehydrogenase [Clostridium pasteurianum]AGK98995.1 alcohol dehydrogenase, class IV [Clostridium pasteurianum BC1]